MNVGIGSRLEGKQCAGKQWADVPRAIVSRCYRVYGKKMSPKCKYEGERQRRQEASSLPLYPAQPAVVTRLFTHAARQIALSDLGSCPSVDTMIGLASCGGHLG